MLSPLASACLRRTRNTAIDVPLCHCPGLNRLADGRLIVTGGDSYFKTSLYDNSDNNWTPDDDMNWGRGYQVKLRPNHTMPQTHHVSNGGLHSRKAVSM